MEPIKDVNSIQCFSTQRLLYLNAEHELDTNDLNAQTFIYK